MSRTARGPRGGLVVIAVLLAVCAAPTALVEVWPSAGAQIAQGLRAVFGPGLVAQIETIVYVAQDSVRQWRVRIGGEQAAPPWGATTPWAATPRATAPPAAATPTRSAITPTENAITPTPATHSHTPASNTPPLSPSPTPTTWQPATLRPLGNLAGEGVWQPYLIDSAGRTLAMRGFLQPDPQRPYAFVAIVAFDLTRTRLHFSLGFNDPAPPAGTAGAGMIPEADRQPGVLLAAFNGGFRAANGMFGAMADGIVALAPRDGAATIAIRKDGTIAIGDWGREISASGDWEAWRQNCTRILIAGEISPKVYSNSTVDWGGSINNSIVTRRSAIGLDATGNTLYYFAGPNLNMPALANAMAAAGVYNGMLLDINNFWVHFTAIAPGENGLTAEPLLPDHMIDKIDRYLGASPVDFFYVTLRTADQP